MVSQGVVEITLHFHFKALLSAVGSFTFYNMKKKKKEKEGQYYPVPVFLNP